MINVLEKIKAGYKTVIDCLCTPTIRYVETLTLNVTNVTVFRDRFFRK